jgi:hypothetical protein
VLSLPFEGGISELYFCKTASWELVEFRLESRISVPSRFAPSKLAFSSSALDISEKERLTFLKLAPLRLAPYRCQIKKAIRQIMNQIPSSWANLDSP